METVKPILRVDVSGEMCPMPVLKTRQAIEKIAVGEVLEVISTDPASKPDFEAWARRTGHKIVAFEEEKSDPVRYHFFIQRVK